MKNVISFLHFLLFIVSFMCKKPYNLLSVFVGDDVTVVKETLLEIIKSKFISITLYHDIISNNYNMNC